MTENYKKLIEMKCYDNGKAKILTQSLHLEGESLATAVRIDFSGTSYKDSAKYIDIVASKHQSRHELGTDEVVEYVFDYTNTIVGEIMIIPFVFDGTYKVKYKPDYNISIAYCPDVGVEVKPNQIDYIFELATKMEKHLDERMDNMQGWLEENIGGFLSELDEINGEVV